MDLTADFRERADALRVAAEAVGAAAAVNRETGGKKDTARELDEMAETLATLEAVELRRHREFAVAISESGWGSDFENE